MKAATRMKAVLLVLGCVAAMPVGAQTVVEAWPTIAVPPPPALEPVTADPAKTALLILDMYPTSCNVSARPSCPATVKPVRSLLDRARKSGMAVIYSAGPPSLNGPTEPMPELARLPGEPTVRGPADKFFGSDLEERLRQRGITTVIVTGTSSDGAVLYTGSSAALRGMKVIVPVDGMSSKERFAELYTAWHLKNTTSTVSRNVVLSRSDLITIP